MKSLEQAYKNIGKFYCEANFPEDKYKLVSVFLDEEGDLYFHLKSVLDQNDKAEIHYHDFNSFWYEYKNISIAEQLEIKFDPTSKNSLTNALCKTVDEINIIYKRLSLEPGSNPELRNEYLRIKNIIRNMCSECDLLFHDKGFF